jgi:hypothetical protein
VIFLYNILKNCWLVEKIYNKIYINENNMEVCLMERSTKYIPTIKGTLRSHMINVPEVIRSASGIKVFGKRIKSFVFTTDVAVIKNNNADAILAVYPFTPQPLITHVLVTASDVSVFCGIGGGLTTGKRVVNLALDAEFQGAMGVVVNSPTSNDVIRAVRDTIDIPIVVLLLCLKKKIWIRE